MTWQRIFLCLVLTVLRWCFLPKWMIVLESVVAACQKRHECNERLIRKLNINWEKRNVMLEEILNCCCLVLVNQVWFFFSFGFFKICILLDLDFLDLDSFKFEFVVLDSFRLGFAVLDSFKIWFVVLDHFRLGFLVLYSLRFWIF